MTKSIDLLSERLAKGEITLEEFEKLKLTLDKTAKSSPSGHPFSIVLLALAGVLVVGVSIAVLSDKLVVQVPTVSGSREKSRLEEQRSAGELHVQSFSASSQGGKTNRVNGAVLVNTTFASGAVVVAVTDRAGVTIHCEKSFNVQPTTSARINLDCAVSPPSSRVKVTARWAD